MPAVAMELFGTDEPEPERRLLRAGQLSAVLEDGNLRDIRFGGVEIIRAINYLARDASWGTFKPSIASAVLEERSDAFALSYEATCGDGRGRLRYRMEITGSSEGTLTLRAEAEALTDFLTNRLGFVVLHPAEAAGRKLTIRHSDGTLEDTLFPRLISADQPAFDIAAIISEAAPGLAYTIEMTGDAFEMEDQRNWTDASYKTYVRPLAKPRPYLISEGTVDRQSIHVICTGAPERPEIVVSGGSALEVGPAIGRMPSIGIFIDETVPAGASALSLGTAQTVIARLDMTEGADRLSHAARLAAESGADLAVELVMDARDPASEALAAIEALHSLGVVPSALLVSPRREFKVRPSGTIPAGEHPIGDLVTALRRAGFAGPIGAGTPSNFTEFNRNPPTPECDFVFFSVSAIVHAADDVSVVETLSVYAMLLESAAALCPGKPIWLGPCTIGTRHNPYGAAPVENPGLRRVAAAQADPRQAALFGAAFAVGIAAQAAGTDVATLTLASPAGPFGLTGSGGEPCSLLAVQRVLAKAAGCGRLAVRLADAECFSIAWEKDNRPGAMIANLSAQTKAIDLPDRLAQGALIEADARLSAIQIKNNRLVIDPYRAVVLGELS